VLFRSLSAGQEDVAIGRTYFLAGAQPVLWRTLGGHIAAAVGRRDIRHLQLPDSLVRVVSGAGEWIGRLTGKTLPASRSRATLARQRYWVCSAARAQRELGLRESRSLPDAVLHTYYWYRDNGWVRLRSRATVPAMPES